MSAAQQPQRDWFDKAALAVATAGTIFIAASAGIATWTGLIFKDQLAEMHASAVTEQRAYVGVDVNLIPAPKTGTQLGYTVTVHNYGNTPAVRAHILTGSFVNDGLEHVFAFEQDALPEGSRDSISLYPGQDRFLGEAFAEADSKQFFSRPSEVIYAHGTIMYQDIYGNTRWTHYCFYWVQEPNGQQAVRSYCPLHNDAN